MVDEEGNVISTSVKESLGAAVDRPIMEANQQSKFSPGMLNGKPVKVKMEMPFNLK